jgi:hypothetical protein
VLKEHWEEEGALAKSGPQLPNVRSASDPCNTTPGATGGIGGTYGSTSGSAKPNNCEMSASTSQNCLAKDAVVLAVPTQNVGEDDDEEAAGNGGDGENAPLIDGYVRKKRTSPKLGTQLYS